jgi:hypothetical protein
MTTEDALYAERPACGRMRDVRWSACVVISMLLASVTLVAIATAVLQLTLGETCVPDWSTTSIVVILNTVVLTLFMTALWFIDRARKRRTRQSGEDAPFLM